MNISPPCCPYFPEIACEEARNIPPCYTPVVVTLGDNGPVCHSPVSILSLLIKHLFLCAHNTTTYSQPIISDYICDSEQVRMKCFVNVRLLIMGSLWYDRAPAWPIQYTWFKAITTCLVPAVPPSIPGVKVVLLVSYSLAELTWKADYSYFYIT